MNVFADIHTPRGRHWAAPLAVCLVAVMAGLRQPYGPASSLVLYAVAVASGALATVNFWHHVSTIVADLLREKRELDWKMSENYRIERLSAMNAEQLKAVRSGKAIFELIPGETLRVDKLFGYEAYEYLLWFIVTKSNDERVYPINNFSAGTFHFDVMGNHAVDDNRQAHNVHEWLVWMGFAEWGRGNISATWKDGWNPDKVLEVLNLTRESYS